jgi:hypothetical protein
MFKHLSSSFKHGVVGAGTASCYGSGSTKMVRSHAAPAPQHCEKGIQTMVSSYLADAIPDTLLELITMDAGRQTT